MKLLRLLCLVFVALTSAPAMAGVYSDALGKCLVASSSDEDKATLVRWSLATLMLHPAAAELSAITVDKRVEINKQAAQLFVRLLTVSCRKEAIEAMKYEGALAMQLGFQTLGQVASTSMMGYPAVVSGFADLLQYVDQEKFRELAK